MSESKVRVEGPSRILTITNAIERVKNEPEIEKLWSGIRSGSFGYVFGPPKTGKTILCENLGINMATNKGEFLNMPLNIKNCRVLFVSMEEFITERTKRNEIQLKSLGISGLDNYFVIDENFPMYFSDKSDFDHLRSIINETKANVVFVDSMTRMAFGEIEESTFCRNMGIELRNITQETNTTMIVIHHTPKLNGGAIGIDSLAGSRILAQEADFLIGVNRTLSGHRYIKDVAFRYTSENEEVLEFSINDDLWIEPIGWTTEQSLLSTDDGRIDNSTRDCILNFFRESENGTLTTANLIKGLVETGKMSRAILFANINSLCNNKKLLKISKGVYSMPE